MLFGCSVVELCSCLLTDLQNSILYIWHWMHLHLMPCFNPWLYLSSPPSLFIHNLCLSLTVMRPLSMSVSFDSSGKDFTVALPLLAHWPCFCGCAWPPRSPLPSCHGRGIDPDSPQRRQCLQSKGNPYIIKID